MLMLFLVFIVFLCFALFIYLFIYLFILRRHYFRLVNSSFCHVLVRGGGPHTNLHNVYMCCSSFVLGVLYIHVYSFLLSFYLFPFPLTL